MKMVREKKKGMVVLDGVDIDFRYFLPLIHFKFPDDIWFINSPHEHRFHDPRCSDAMHWYFHSTLAITSLGHGFLAHTLFL